MNTRTSEIRLILSEIIRASLKQGIVPDFMDVVSTKEYHDIGAVKPINSIVSEVANTSEINSGFDAISYNLKILEESATLQTLDISNHRATFPLRISRLERWYRKLAYRVQSLILLTRTGTKSLYSVSDTFSTLADVDLENTTAYIDTVRGLAEISFSPLGGNEEDAESGSANVGVTSVVLRDNGIVKSILSGTNEVYYKHISESRDGVELEVRFRINRMNDIFNGGRMEFQLGFPANTDIVSVIGTSDNKNFEDLEYLQNSSHVFIPVSKMYQDKYITILFRKNNHEGEKIDDLGTVRHQFIFDIGKIRLPNRRYKETGIVQTVPRILPTTLSQKGIAQWQLIVDGYTPGDTKVDSSVAFDSGAFLLVPTNTIMPIGLVSYEQTRHPFFTVTRQVPTPICKLEGTTNEPVLENAVLLEGYDQAEIESQDYATSAAELPHWIATPGTAEYQDMSITGVYLGKGLSHKVFFKIKSNIARDIILSNLGVINQESPAFNQAEYMTMYFNGQRLTGKKLPDDTVEYRLPLIAGDNTVNLLVGITDSSKAGYLNISSPLLKEGIELYVKERAATSMAAILNLDPVQKSYAVYNNNIYINYIPARNAKFIHRYALPTAELPSTVTLRFDMASAGGVSPFITGYRMEFTTGSAA